MFELNFGEFRTDITTTDDVLRVEAILERKWGSARRAAPVVLKPSSEESAVHELISLSAASLTKSDDAADLLGRLGLSPESVEALERLEKSLTQHGEHEREGGEGGAAETPPETAGDEDGDHESGERPPEREDGADEASDSGETTAAAGYAGWVLEMLGRPVGLLEKAGDWAHLALLGRPLVVGPST